MMKGDINTYQMVKPLSRLMQRFPLFGVDEVSILPQNGYFVTLYKNDAYNLFHSCMTIADLDLSISNGENRIEIETFLPTYRQKIVIIWAQI